MVTQSRPSLKILPNEQKALDEFIQVAQENYGSRILRVALFGSKARGDSTLYSDMDVLLIVKDDSWTFQEALIAIGADIGLKYDVLLDLRIISDTRWKYMENIQAGLYRNISQDAIPLAA